MPPVVDWWKWPATRFWWTAATPMVVCCEGRQYVSITMSYTMHSLYMLVYTIPGYGIVIIAIDSLYMFVFAPFPVMGGLWHCYTHVISWRKDGTIFACFNVFFQVMSRLFAPRQSAWRRKKRPHGAAQMIADGCEMRWSCHLWLVVWNMTFSFPYIGKNHPNWLIFFRGVETTNHL